jgi:hypothetical protein
MLGERRLDQDLTSLIAATGPAGDLHDRLRESLVAAEIRAEKALIGIQDSDERDARKIMPFRQHLRADEYVGVAACDAFEHGRKRTAARSDVAIQALDAPVGEERA